jgi:AcrR family transcriptional regulator
MVAPIRPAKPIQRAKTRDLTREKVIAATLSLINQAGADTVTMRRVAESVGVTPMALYNHFSSKRTLLAAAAESVIAAAQFDGGRADWRDQILNCFVVLRDLCLNHPGLPHLLQTKGAAPTNVFAPMEVTLRALREAGFDDVDSTRTYFLLMSFTLAQSAYQLRPIPDLETIRAERIAGRGYQSVERLELPATWDFDGAFKFGISLILAGVEATIFGTGAHERKSPPRS